MLWGVILYLFFGTVTLGSYNFIVIISRYFLLVSVPLAVLASYALCRLSEAAAQHLKRRSLYFELAFLALIVLTNLPLYSTLYNYNLSISGDVMAFSNLLNYLNAAPIHGNTHGFISVSNNSGDMQILRLISGYSKNFSISSLNFSSRGNLTRWASQECSPGAPGTYLILEYQSTYQSLYYGILDSWIRPYCSLTRIGMAEDSASAYGTYNGMNVVVDLYRVGS